MCFGCGTPFPFLEYIDQLHVTQWEKVHVLLTYVYFMSIDLWFGNYRVCLFLNFSSEKSGTRYLSIFNFIFQASWVDKMKECLENRLKMSRRKMKRQGDTASPSAKRQRSSHPKDHLLQRSVFVELPTSSMQYFIVLINCRYPVRVQDVESEDPRSVVEHNKALCEEMKKPKPRDALLLPLMKKTFQDRRIFIQNDASTVVEILEHYPAMARPAVVSLVLSTTIE